MSMNDLFIGRKVLVRATNSGVHFGTLVERDGQEVLLEKARRIWSWSGALSLNEIATEGPNLEESKISEEVAEMLVFEAIEIIPIESTSNLFNYNY